MKKRTSVRTKRVLRTNQRRVVAYILASWRRRFTGDSVRVVLWKAAWDRRCRACAVRSASWLLKALRRVGGGLLSGNLGARECAETGWSHGGSRCSLRTETAEKSLTTPEKVANRFWQWKSERRFERSSEFCLFIISICASLPVRSPFPPISKMIRVKMVTMTGSNNTQRLLSGGGLRFPFTTAESVNSRTGERGVDSGATKICINFDQTQEAYKSKNSLELLRSLVVFKLCSYDILVDKNKEVM